jgi:CHRD domain
MWNKAEWLQILAIGRPAGRRGRSINREREDTMHCNIRAGTLGTVAFMLLGAHANAADFSATFSGFEEIGGLGAGETGAIFSPGKATLDLDLNRKTQTIKFKLTYSGFPSTSTVTQAHIHFAKVHVAGGIIVFFCSNVGGGPKGTPACPTPNGTVKGTITTASVIGPAAQNVNPGDFGALVAALDSNTAYGNIHTVNFPAGEIRGQILKGEELGRD